MKMKEKKNKTGKVTNNVGLLTDHDIYLFKQGNHHNLYDKLGPHLMTLNGENGAAFTIWAPSAKEVSVVGDFNRWNRKTQPLKAREDESGIWEGFIPGIKKGDVYKYHILSRHNKYRVDKGDPFAPYWELPPKTASKVWDLDY